MRGRYCRSIQMCWWAGSCSTSSARSISEQTETSRRWFHLIVLLCLWHSGSVDGKEEAWNLRWFDDNCCGPISAFCSQNKQVVAWYLLWTQAESVEVWTAGTGASIHQHMTQFWPAELFYWGVSREVGLYHHKNIHRGVRAELQQLKLRPSLTQVSCPCSVD